MNTSNFKIIFFALLLIELKSEVIKLIAEILFLSAIELISNQVGFELSLQDTLSLLYLLKYLMFFNNMERIL